MCYDYSRHERHVDGVLMIVDINPRKTMVTVDVIVPCYNYGHFLRECVESVLNQVGPSIRVLIIDDASPDDSASVGNELAASDGRVTFLSHEQNRGHIATYNEGIDWISARYMLLLSADDYLLPGALERATAVMEARPEVGFVFGAAMELFDDGTKRIMQAGGTINRGESWQVLKGSDFIACSGARNIVPTPTAVVKTELLKRSGGYRPEMPHTADMELWWRLAALGSVGVVRECQAVYRCHAHNMSLGYYAKRCLPDIQQRRTVLDVFFAENRAMIPNAAHLRDRAYGILAREAIGSASAAFNDGDHELVQELEAIAAEMFPGVRNTGAWRKLQFKRRIGWRTWNFLRGKAKAAGGRIRQGDSSGMAAQMERP